MAFYREHQQRHPDAGHPVVSFVGKSPRELTFLSPEEQGAEPWEDDEIMTEVRATRRMMCSSPNSACVPRRAIGNGRTPGCSTLPAHTD
jgi:hypothetical protein